MEKIKRNERLAAMTAILTASPNQIFTLSYFCDLFFTAKSTVSEDVAILQETMKQFRLGQLETVTGAAGGVRYRPVDLASSSRPFIEGICRRLIFSGRNNSDRMYLNRNRSDNPHRIPWNPRDRTARAFCSYRRLISLNRRWERS